MNMNVMLLLEDFFHSGNFCNALAVLKALNVNKGRGSCEHEPWIDKKKKIVAYNRSKSNAKIATSSSPTSMHLKPDTFYLQQVLFCRCSYLSKMKKYIRLRFCFYDNHKILLHRLWYRFSFSCHCKWVMHHKMRGTIFLFWHTAI